ncbi:unnamed protein product [Tilletia controversa]|uniref:Uncharacterized protein n=3 Tax=Tilletia TaxID=13289 RepID=A0A8X7SZN4_9BASI|nr:hypothetical protein CF336_g9012 [Tilletia laevis]KAE8181714.1 hypothetical protein CF328_g8755 [Tilletia controversa]KAE8239051.1 hypothetical protein A4X03_0g8716 [Tilletia caries]KAE8182221.1 hypothetical protein CF335_g8698 [Tilletia laevis]KAE8253331.1 hypothetical protein A4X06_0g1544 [Tilletia controversa]
MSTSFDSRLALTSSRRSLRASGSLESVSRQRSMTENIVLEKPTSRKRSLPASRSMPVVWAESQQQGGEGNSSFLADITCVGSTPTKDMSWLEHRSNSSQSTVLQRSMRNSRRSNSSSSSSSSSTGSFSPWVGSQSCSPSPVLADTARMEPPAPWEQTFDSYDSQQEYLQQHQHQHHERAHSDHIVDHLADLDRSMTLSSDSDEYIETLDYSPAFSAALLPPASLQSPSASYLYLGEPTAPQPPSDPAHLIPGNRGRRVPLAEIPLWYADVRGEAIRRGKHERSSLSNSIDFSSPHVLSDNTSHNIPGSDSYYLSPSQASSQSSFSVGAEQGFGNLSSIAENSGMYDGHQLFVLPDDEQLQVGGSPRRKELRSLRRQSISEQHPYPSKKTIAARGR